MNNPEPSLTFMQPGESLEAFMDRLKGAISSDQDMTDAETKAIVEHVNLRSASMVYPKRRLLK